VVAESQRCAVPTGSKLSETHNNTEKRVAVERRA
jgi:hypothetical protein